MKRKHVLIHLMILVLLSACASGIKTKAVGVSGVEKDFEEIENADFSEIKKEINYSNESDYIQVGDDQLAGAYLEALGPFGGWKHSASTDDLDDISKMGAKCRAGKFEEMEEIFKKVHPVYDKRPDFWNVLGICYFLQGKKRMAHIYFSEALSQKKNYPPAYNNLGVLSFYENNSDEALAFFKKALSASSKATVPRLNKALVYLKYGLNDSAINSLKGVSIEDNFPRAILGTALLQLGRIEESLKVFSAIEKELKTTSWGLNYALALKKSGKGDDAEDVLDSLEGNKISIPDSIDRYIRGGKK